MNRKTESHAYVLVRTKTGETRKVFVPRNSADIDNQSDVPAAVLALIAFSPIVDGVVNYSSFTYSVMKQLQRQVGDETLRRVLSELLDEISRGFKPHNPFGLFVSRVRGTMNGGNFIQL